MDTGQYGSSQAGHHVYKKAKNKNIKIWKKERIKYKRKYCGQIRSSKTVSYIYMEETISQRSNN